MLLPPFKCFKTILHILNPVYNLSKAPKTLENVSNGLKQFEIV